jgi:transcriptional antiterminator NusG
MGQELKWYVVRAVSGKEKKAKELIESEILHLNAQELVPQILIPMEKVLQVKNGKKQVKERSYFPGYILIQASLNGDLISSIKNLPNIVGFLGEKDQPIPLREAEVNKILGKFDEVAVGEETVLVPYAIGETVRVTDGPFNSFTGIIEEVNEEKKKLKVMVKIFGRKTPLELSYVQVEKL